MSVTDEIKSRLDIVNYIQQFTPLKKAGRNYKANCPFHSEKTPSFVVNPETQTWRCFGSCATGGDIFSFAQKYHGWSFTEALAELGKLAGVEVTQQTDAQREQTVRLDSLRGLMQAAADYYHHQLLEKPSVLDYVRGRRGFNDETISIYQIGYAPEGWQVTLDYLTQLGYAADDLVETGLARRSDNGRLYDYFRNRLMIPIRDERGRVIGFGARALSDEDNPKYLNSPQTPLFDKSHVLFGLDRARGSIREYETAVIVEGYMDAIQAHQAGFLNVVAQMGTALTETQLKKLVPRWANKLILALDADSAGQNATMRSLEVAREALRADLSGRLTVDIRILTVPGSKDPDDFIRETPERWPELIENALPVADYVIEMEVAQLPQRPSVQEREAVARRLLPILLASESNLYRQDNIQKLALRLHISENDLLMWAAQQTEIQRSRPPRRVTTEQEPPPLPLTAEPPGEWEDAADAPSLATLQPVSRTILRREVDCLAGLLIEPALFYHINRKLRELSAGNTALWDGPLALFGEMDFQSRDHQQIMSCFLMALEQDNLEPLAYVREHVPPDLLHYLDAEILVNGTDHLLPHLRHGLAVDLLSVMKHVIEPDRQTEILKVALRMRLSRVESERESLYFLVMDADPDDQMALYEQIQLSVLAKSLIDEELQRQTQAL